MSKRRNKRSLFSTVICMLLCVSMMFGSTYAWFTDSVENVNNVIAAGNLNLEVEYKVPGSTDWEELKADTQIFNSTKWEPGHTEAVALRIENAGSLALKYKMGVNVISESGSTNVAGGEFNLSDHIKFGVVSDDKTANREAAVQEVAANATAIKNGHEQTDRNLAVGAEEVITMVVYMPTTVGNEANHKTGVAAPEIKLGLAINATQLTAEKDSFDDQYDKDAAYPGDPDTWDGTADISWYNDTDTEFTITTAEQMAGLAELVDGGNYFAGKTLKLGRDIDLAAKDANGKAICFEPIGSYRNDKSFKGTFDGQGYTIKNMNQNTWALDNGYYYTDCGLGLFGALEGATVKNLIIDKASISGESALCGSVAAVADNAIFENITVTNTQVADYQYYAGGIVGWASGDHQYINCNVDASTTIAAQWGDFDNSTGGIIGGCGGSATILMKDCNVACRIDAYNDVTSSYQWYAYRRCGMLIGNTGKTVKIDGRTVADAPKLTCENVNVIYGNWANYTYCEFAGTSWPYVRVQEGVSNSAYSNPRYGHPSDANGKEVVDDNHVHNDGEDHQILCEFDQLYGGGQGVYGNPVHNGVKVVYNNR